MNADPKKQAKFLAAYAETGTITQAEKASGVANSSHYRWLKGDPTYAERFEEAKCVASDRMEEEARRRAVDGWEEPVFYEGQIVGHKRRYSDTLLIFLLKANNPAKFGDRVEQRHTAQVTSPVRIYLPHNNRTAFEMSKAELTREN